MEKVPHFTNHLLVKASTDSDWDDCTFAIIYCTKHWLRLLAKRSSSRIPFEADGAFYSLTYWDNHVDFFVHIDNGEEDSLSGSDLLPEDEKWAFVILTEKEVGRFKRPQNKIRAHQLKITMDGCAQFKAWGEDAKEIFYTEKFSIDSLIGQQFA
jgi:hypothetical protein